VVIGGGKDGVPIILGNVDTPSPQAAPAAGTTPRTTAAPHAMPLEKVPSAGSAEPSEKTVPSAAAPEVPRTYFPFPIGMSEIEAFFSRFTGPTTGSGASPSPK